MTPLGPPIPLIFADFPLFPKAKGAVSSFSVRSDELPHFQLTDDLCMVFADLTKDIKDIEKTVDNKDLWRYFLKRSGAMDLQELELLASKNEEMRMAAEEFKRISEEDRIRGQEFLREKAIRDYISWRHYFKTRRAKVLEEGHKEGLKEGQLKGQKQIALNMLKAKMDVSQVAQMTGLSKKEILKLKVK